MNVSHPDLVVLGLLADQPRHGYELRKEIASMRLRHWARIGDSTVYAALRRLERKGLLSRQTEATDGRPDRQVYRLTTAGRQRLTELIIAALESSEPAYSDRLVGAVFGAARASAGDRDEDATLAALRASSSRLVDATERLARLEQSDELSPLGRIIVRFNREVVSAERRALEAIRRRAADVPARPSVAPGS
jgi:DNA-binding PadR family transcriptional regulator